MVLHIFIEPFYLSNVPLKLMDLKYKVICSFKQYKKYCEKKVELESQKITKKHREEIELLTVLIEKYDEENTFLEKNPVELLIYLMEENNIRSIEVAKQLKVSPGVISDIINYRKGFSKNIIRDLSKLFKISQEAFNRPYNFKKQFTQKVKLTTRPGKMKRA